MTLSYGLDTGRLPGQNDLGSWTPREIIWIPGDEIYAPGVILDSTNSIDGSNTGYTDELRPGCIMAQITASRKFVPCKRTLANGAGTAATALIVDNAAFFIAGETLTIGATTGIISSVNYLTNTITLTAAKTWADNAIVYTSTLKDGTTSAAGVETALAVLSSFIKFNDRQGVAYDRVIGNDPTRGLLIRGQLISAMLLGDVAAIQADTAAKVFAHIMLDASYGFNAAA